MGILGVEPSYQDVMTETREQKTIPVSAEPAAVRLVFVSGRQVGRVVTIRDQAVLGRGNTVDVTIDDEDVSREHARISLSENEYTLEDLGSSNGTFVNGERVTQQQIHIGDTIVLGRSVALRLIALDPVDDLLRERQRLEMIGRIGLGIAHDFNNMLSALITNVDYLRELPPDRRSSDDAAESLDEMKQALERASQLSLRLLRSASPRGRAHVPVDVTHICHEVHQLVRSALPGTIVIEKVIAPRLRVLGDGGGLHQALLNLCLNARDAMQEQGTLSIRAARVTEPNDDQGFADLIRIEVSDTGSGMTEETRNRIFEPFFTTKAQGAGFGLGLATVKDIIEVHGGDIVCSSSPGNGTTFSITLPTLPRGRALSKPSATLNFGVRGPIAAARVLVVDDEPMLRRGLARVLRQGGHTVAEASNAEEAVAAYQELAPNIVLLDLDLGEITGDEVFDQLLAIDASAHVLFMTGHRGAERERSLVARGAVGVLQKPLGADELLDAVGTAMAAVSSDDELTL